MKKQWMSAAAVALMGVSIAGCSALFNSKESISPVDSVSDVYALSGLSSAALLTRFGATSLSTITSDSSTLTTLSAEGQDAVLTPVKNDVDEEELAKINQYLSTFESLLEGDGALNSVVAESDREGYTTLLTVTTKGIDGFVSTYKIYYNETEIVPEETIPEEDEVVIPDSQASLTLPLRSEKGRNFGWKFREKENPKVRQFDEFDGVSSSLEGVLVVGSGESAVEYTVTGMKVVKDDQVFSRFISMIDNWNFVQVNQRISDGKQVFQYIVVENARIVSRSEVSVNTDEEGVAVRLRFTDDSSKNLYTFRKEVEETRTIIKIHYNSSESNGVIRVVIATDETSGEAVYEYFFAESNRHWGHFRSPWKQEEPAPAFPEPTPESTGGEAV